MGILLVIILVCGIIKLASDWSTSYNCQKRGHEAFQQACKGMKERQRRTAKEGDFYYDGGETIDMLRYGDGSWRYTIDSKPLKKGERFGEKIPRE